MDDQPSAMTIAEFCKAHRISRGLYYNLKNEGRGPREMWISAGRRAISQEAAAAWRREREAEAEAVAAR
jgi:hypothetical protein